MTDSKRMLSLNLFVMPGGHHEAAWRYKDAPSDGLLSIEFYQDLARRAEAGTFDALFFADGPALFDDVRYVSRYRLEPITWLSAIAAATKHIGLIATASTTYYEPYNLARLFSSLDHLSHGRAGWNIVTSSMAEAAPNFGLADIPANEVRYKRSAEFVDVVSKLWDSWEDEAFVADKASGILADISKIHSIDHAGGFFKVKGPLTIPRSPQGRPVFVQAGSSDDGRSFAAQHAEAIFTAHQSIDSAREFYADVKKRAQGYGRSPDHIRILPGLSIFLGSTEAEAKRLYEEFNELIQPEFSISQIKRFTGIDLSGLDLDKPVPAELVRDAKEPAGLVSRFHVVMNLIKRENPTIRQLMRNLAGGRGHFVKTGTPEQIAGEMQTWFETGASDGFNLMPPWWTGGLDIFIQEVVPLLRKRGIFREQYTGSTLRDHYGLPRPASQYS